jgi:hypothetical protein
MFVSKRERRGKENNIHSIRITKVFVHKRYLNGKNYSNCMVWHHERDSNSRSFTCVLVDKKFLNKKYYVINRNQTYQSREK